MNIFRVLTIIVIGAIFTLLFGFQPEANPVNAAVVIPEGNDFATRVLRDTWDMSQYSDISQYINSDDSQSALQNIQVTNGVFSAHSISTDPLFFVLFPGYLNTISVGKVGDQFPIDSSVYKCMYFAMKVDSGPSNTGPDPFQIFWFGNKDMTQSFGTYTNVVAGTPTNRYWNLYSVNLASPSLGAAWTSQTYWKGLRIDPTIQSNVNFAVDWVRLTDCSTRNYKVSWPQSVTSQSIWARPVGASHNIRLAAEVSGTSATLDLQGMQPGNYELVLGTGNDTCCSTTSLGTVEINQAPIVQISRPSFTSGASYGSQIGNPWDMSDSQDATTDCMASSIQNGLLVMDTPSFENQPGPCVSGNISDPKVFLNSPQQVNTSEYRYFTFKMKTDGALQKFGKGMMARFIWAINSCDMVSLDMPYDVGWNTLSIDLYDPIAGNAVQWYGTSCPAGPISWRSNQTVGQFRFDPNENISGSTFHQELDWVSLNKVDQVKRGNRFPLGVSVNKATNLVSLSYYYTTTITDTKQHVIYIAPTGGSTPRPSAAHYLFLPTVAKDYDPSLSGNTLWDTTNVAAGTYYICVEANDGLNSGIFCSEAPVNVTN